MRRLKDWKAGVKAQADRLAQGLPKQFPLLMGESFPQGLSREAQDAFSFPHDGIEIEEGVNGAGDAGIGDRDACLTKGLSICGGFVAEGIKSGCDDDGGGEVFQVRFEAGGELRAGDVGDGSGVLQGVPFEHAHCQEIAATKGFSGGEVLEAVGCGVEHDLEGEVDFRFFCCGDAAVLIADALGEGGGKRASGAVAGDGDFSTPAPGFRGEPVEGGP